MKSIFWSLTLALACLSSACGTSSSTITGPSLDRCSITVANSMSSVAASGGNGRVSVTAGRECTWSVTTNVPWIALTAASGQGDGGVDYRVSANPSPESRRGVVVVGGQSLEVVQEALACRFDFQPANGDFGPEGGTGTVNVSGPSGCSWTPTASEEWITITNGGSRNGDGGVNFSIAPNSGGPRNGRINIGGQSFNIAQAAPACRIQLSAIAETFAGSGGRGTVNVTTPPACTWTVSSNVPWISIISGASDSGNGTVTFSVQSNTGPARNGIVTIGGQRFTITQLQAACSYTVSSAGQSFPAAGGQSSVAISTNSICTWNTSDVPTWVSGMPASGTGSQTINFTVDANLGSARTANIIIGGQTFAVSQAEAPVVCSYSLNPTSHNAAAAGGSSSFAVDTAGGCGWTSSGVPAWITGVPANGTGPRTINFTVAANPGAARSANIIIGGKTFAVSQPAAAVVCNYSLNPTSHNATAAGGASSFAVTTANGCAWTSSGVPAWITGVPANGTGPQTINFTVASNSGAARSANIIIGGQTFAVSQAASAVVCNYSLNPTSHNATAAGGASAFDVTTTSGCDWTSSGVPAWITGVPGNGTGTQTINFTVAANSGAARNADIVIGGQTFGVTQAAGAVVCSYSLNPTSHNATAAGGSSSFDVTTTAGCNWAISGVPAWVTGVPANGTSTQTINFTVAANTGGARNASIVVEGQTFTVSQASGCSYSLNPNNYAAPVAGGSSSFDVTTTSGCDWTSSGVPAWITGVPANGSGTQTINFTVAANTGPARNASIVIGSQTFSVSQASGCTYAVAPASLTFGTLGIPARDITVTTESGCAWNATPSEGWIRIVSGSSGSGSGVISIELNLYIGLGARTGEVTVGGQTVGITQTGL